MKRVVLAAAALALCATAALAAPKTPSKAEREDVAVKMMAIFAFVKTECPEIEPRDYMLLGALNKLGVDPAEILNNRARKSQAETLLALFYSDKSGSCAMAWSKFGTDSTYMPGMMQRR